MSQTFVRKSPRTGGAGVVVLVVLAVVVLGALLLGVPKYNALVSADAGTEKAFTEIQNMYKRRYDLIPQLIETVKGAANFEKSTITAVTEARASVGRVQVDPSNASAEDLQRFFASQSGLSSALSRLMVVAESYPELRASEAFRDLQVQIEGTENRIAVARTDYIEAVNDYNVTVRKFPGNLIAGVAGFEQKPQLEFEEDVSKRPEVKFD